MRLLALLLLGVAPTIGAAQKVVSLPRAEDRARIPRDSIAVRAPVLPAPSVPTPSFRRLSAASFVLSRLDDNVNRDSLGIPSVGVISGLALRYVSAASRPGLTVEYDVAVHRYSATERFDRISHRGRITAARRLNRAWGVDLVTEGSLAGSFEDRDVSDQLQLLPRAELRLGPGRRVRAVAAARWRRYPTSADQNAVNGYLALEFRHRFDDQTEWETEIRTERNDARLDRFDYRRLTYASTYTTPLGKGGSLELEMQYRLQTYTGRFVEVEDEDIFRRDHRFQPTLSLLRPLGPIDVTVTYEPELRRSNDPTRRMDQHVVLIGLSHRW